jgi:phospholipid/cholesterol/gamma-HCH transport system substrate-binding protein
MIRLRHTDEWVGLLVIVAVLLFLGSVLEAGVLRDWFRPVSHLRIVLPQAGVGGLAVGADVEVLGIHAGIVRRIVLNPNQQMYAEADIDQQAEAFIRRDSEAVIRRRFGLAGAAYVDISRGTGASLDWTYAVVDASERQPTRSVRWSMRYARRSFRYWTIRSVPWMPSPRSPTICKRVMARWAVC